MSDPPFPQLYEGIWGVLVRWFRVPDAPPSLPLVGDEEIRVFRAAPGYLQYCRLGYWIGFFIALIVFAVGLVVLTVVIPPLGIALAIPALIVFPGLAVLNYVALYLAYDTTWYAVGPHSVRVRGGVWTNREVTINYDNVQNVSTSQGPLQRRFGISNVRIDTAGLGSAGNQYESAKAAGVSLIGLNNAEEIKALIQARCDASQSAGLGDEAGDVTRMLGGAWSADHLAVLREIRDAAAAMRSV